MPTFSNLNDLAKHISAKIDGEVKFSDLFTFEFMHKYTKYTDIYKFLNDGGFSCDNEQQFSSIKTDDLDKYVSTETSFSSWEEMKQAAGNIFAKRKLGIK